MAKAAKKKEVKVEDKRIEAISLLIEKGYIKTWAGIFEYIPRSTVATHLGTNNDRMKQHVEDPSKLTLETLAAIAAFLKVKFTVIAEFAYKAMPVAKRVKGDG